MLLYDVQTVVLFCKGWGLFIINVIVRFGGFHSELIFSVFPMKTSSRSPKHNIFILINQLL